MKGDRPPPLPPDRLAACVEALEALAEDRALLAVLPMDQRRRLLIAAGRLSRPERTEQRSLAKAFRRRDREAQKAADGALLDATGIRTARCAPVFQTPRPSLPSSQEPRPSPGEALRAPRKCYVCKAEYREVHFFYDAMCPACGDFNYRKRNQTASLEGRVALITGARVKIGYQAAIKLLRAGARVVVTTRFPADAARRYAEEADFEAWGARLSIHGLDLRHTPSVEGFTRHLDRTLDRLDFIINNACQTVRRPPGFYAHLLEAEAAAALLEPPLLSQLRTITDAAMFPLGLYDADQQQVDLRDVNSWRLLLGDVPSAEMLEVQLCNAVAPFVLNARLKPLLLRHRTLERHIVNVSAVEGQFYRAHKTDRHPHTNMAKAALNMMTRTSAPDYARDGIFMNSVDTGWVTDEDPAQLAAQKTEEHGFHPPLDIVDGAARICDPIFSGLLTGSHVWGQFLKDYQPVDW